MGLGPPKWGSDPPKGSGRASFPVATVPALPAFLSGTGLPGVSASGASGSGAAGAGRPWALTLARRYLGEAETEPDPLQLPTFPAELGLPGRRPRAMVASAEQLAGARVPLEQRDFCAHHLVRLLRCQRDAFPWPAACAALRHGWDGCQHRE
ncbi:NADH dehydrogenase [ubiquinone] 1 beta subcomplex subunit 7 [Opisthocomus hoazin]|uniref:NADH dehydrogenase [ubiquinone] 1 beta subcomplex subunit 7 n=1 Tax=Opisthocomus hoazin TaxID=30419 RepID=UPI003F529412